MALGTWTTGLNTHMDITSANAVMTLTCEQLYASGVTLEMFSTDQFYNSDNVDWTETRMGVDGRMVAGYTPNILPVTISLEPSSPSFEVFQNIAAAMRTNRTIYRITLTARLDSIGKRITWSNGVLKSTPLAMSAKRVLEPVSFVLHFQDYDCTDIS